MRELAVGALLLAAICLGACALGPGHLEGEKKVEVLPGISVAVPDTAVRTSTVGLDSRVATFEGNGFELLFDRGMHGALPDYGRPVFEHVALANGITLDAVRGVGASERYPYGFAMMQVVDAPALEDNGFGVPSPTADYLVVTAGCLEQRKCDQIFDLMKKTLRIGSVGDR